MPTKHRIFRLNDATWAQLVEIFRQAVPPDRRPPFANPKSDWQVSEGLRMVAKGELIIRPK